MLPPIFSLRSTRCFGDRITALARLKSKREADFRFSLVRVRESAESVAFYRGGAMERRIAGRFFDAVVKTMDDLIQWYQRLAAFQIIVQYITTVAPAVIVAPMYDIYVGAVEYIWST